MSRYLLSFWLVVIGSLFVLSFPVSATLHFTANESGDYNTSRNFGFNVHDVGMNIDTINSLADGDKALVWYELGKSCPDDVNNPPTSVDATFKAFVDANYTNQKIFGYYFSDEPTDGTCVGRIKLYADYLHSKYPANATFSQKSYVLLTDWPGTYAAYAPVNSHLDLIGLDPYPVGKNDNYDKTGKRSIPYYFNEAVAAGIPPEVICPTFQTFGNYHPNDAWDPPTAAELEDMLATWDNLFQSKGVTPVLDYAYSWGTQNGNMDYALINRSDWRTVMAAHNAKSAATATPTQTPAKVIGDANGDDKADLLDFGIWKKEYLGQLTTKTADFDTSGTVNLIDFGIWKKAYLGV